MDSKIIHPRNLLLFCMGVALAGSGASVLGQTALRLTDVPLGTQNRAEPNIMLSFDDSGSMLFHYLPDAMPKLRTNANTNANPTYVAVASVDYGYRTGCWNDMTTTPSGTVPVGTVPDSCPEDGILAFGGQTTNAWSAATHAVNITTNIANRTMHAPMMAAAFNKMAYNPLVKYEPPKKYNGTSYPNMDRLKTSNWTRVVNKDYWTWAESPSPPADALDNLNTFRYTYPAGWKRNLIQSYLVNSSPAILNLFNQAMPIHYFRTSVKWCRTKAASGPWSGGGAAQPGFGSGIAADCQETRDGAHLHPYFYYPMGQYTGRYNNVTNPAFQLVVLDVSNPTTYRHPYFNEETGQVEDLVRTFDEEMTNYANWYTYYRRRMEAAKTVASLAFSPLDETVRVGFSTISSHTAGNTGRFQRIEDFNLSQKQSVYNLLLNTSFQTVGTKLRETTGRIGEYFMTGTTPGGASGSRPITFSCQKNYHILFTDGQWNDTAPPTIANHDRDPIGVLPPLFEENGITRKKVDIHGLLVETGTNQSVNWPRPIYDAESNTGGGVITLADIALHYWRTDLLTSYPASTTINGFTRFFKDSSNVTIKNVQVAGLDKATWSHLNFIGMGFGVQGSLPIENVAQTQFDIRNGTRVWPRVVSQGETTVDDLWHASVNGFGTFVPAASPDEFLYSLSSILAGIRNLGGSRAGVGYATPNFPADPFTYVGTFEAGWTGELTKYEFNEVTGQRGAAVWRASEKLVQSLMPTIAVPEPWLTKRKIVTRKSPDLGAEAIPFQWDKLTAAQKATLGGVDSGQKRVVSYLRGDSSGEGVTMGKFRPRGSPLGDIIDASPVVVSMPNQPPKPGRVQRYKYAEKWEDLDGTTEKPYSDEPQPVILNGGYKAFSDAYKTRQTFIYAAANDGMLHAFRAEDEPGGEGKAGEEIWAYMPSELLLRRADQQGIVNLTYQEGGIPNSFAHYHYVNATPRVADVYARGEWRTVLVGGLGKGGTSYYALDITEPDKNIDTENNVAEKVLWEFTNPNMGYTYGRPLLVKTRAFGERWVAIFPSGLNNGSGSGHAQKYDGTYGDGKCRIFFVDISDGSLLHQIPPLGQPPMDGCEGLAHISGYVVNEMNQRVLNVYGGDQNGNFWRFNLDDRNHLDWNVIKLAELKDREGVTGKPQPVTTEPISEVGYHPEAKDIVSGKPKQYRMVIIGTGRLLHMDDRLSDVMNTLYAFIDGDLFDPRDSSEAPWKRSDLIEVQYDSLEPSINPQKTAAEGGEGNEGGWYMDMKMAPEQYPNVAFPPKRFHIVAQTKGHNDPYASYQSTIFAATTLHTDVPDKCTPSLFESYFFDRNFLTADSYLGIRGEGRPPEKAYIKGSGNIVHLGYGIIDGKLASFFIDEAGRTTVASSGEIPKLPPGTLPSRRLSIRFLTP
jgi:type IV pilus assembly protein PilY1